MIKYRVFDTRLSDTYEPNQVMNIDYEREMVTLKNERGYKFTRFFCEVLFLSGSGIKDSSKEPVEIFEQDCVLISSECPEDKPFYGIVKYNDGAFLVVNPTLGNVRELSQVINPITVIGNTYNSRGNK